MNTILRLQDYAYAYPGSEDNILKGVNLEIRAGQCHCLTGDTGSGKTTLALAIKGLLPPGRQAGRIVVPVRPDGRPGVGVVLQNPETQLLTPTVGAEVAFGLENLCVAPATMPGKVAAALDAVGLHRPADFDADKLSMGQKYRLIVAALLVMAPSLLVLDEPSAQLDADGLAHLLEVIRRLKASGVSFLLCEHRPEFLVDVVDVCWHLEDGTVRPRTMDVRDRKPSAHTQESENGLPAADAAGEAVKVCDLTVAGTHGSPVWSGASFAVGKGQRVAVCGPNGEGKTTLVRCLTGFVQPAKGTVQILGERPDPERLRGRVGCLFQNPPKQLFEATVFEEVTFPLRRLGANGRDVRRRAEETLGLCGIEDLAERSPHKLSYGQKHLVALASVLAPSPELLLMDDPFAGLDRRRRQTVQEVMVSLSRDKQTTVIWTSHNPDMLPPWTDFTLCVQGGAIVPQ